MVLGASRCSLRVGIPADSGFFFLAGVISGVQICHDVRVSEIVHVLRIVHVVDGVHVHGVMRDVVLLGRLLSSSSPSVCVNSFFFSGDYAVLFVSVSGRHVTLERLKAVHVCKG